MPQRSEGRADPCSGKSLTGPCEPVSSFGEAGGCAEHLSIEGIHSVGVLSLAWSLCRGSLGWQQVQVPCAATWCLMPSWHCWQQSQRLGYLAGPGESRRDIRLWQVETRGDKGGKICLESGRSLGGAQGKDRKRQRGGRRRKAGALVFKGSIMLRKGGS